MYNPIIVRAFAGCDEEAAAGDGAEWVRVTETELEGADDDSGLPRRIRLDIALERRVVALTLERNDHVPTNVTVVVGRNGQLSTSAPDHLTDRVRSQSAPRYYC